MNMKRHRSFEFFVGDYFRQQGYTDVDVTQGVADWGVDAFAMKDGKKYVVQAINYAKKLISSVRLWVTSVVMVLSSSANCVVNSAPTPQLSLLPSLPISLHAR